MVRSGVYINETTNGHVHYSMVAVKQKKPSRAKHWVFTLNNYTEDDISHILNQYAKGDETDISYVCFGKEVGDSGTPHLQGYISLGSKRGFNYVRGLFTGSPHIEVSYGTPDEAIAYCEKEGEFVEYGERPRGKGSRSDLHEVQDLVRRGGTLREIADSHFGTFCRFERAIRSYLAMYAVSRSEPPHIRVLWGVTGSGKTRAAYEGIELAEVYSHSGGQWFDGYHGQRRAIFDDFGGSEFKLTYLLKLLDRYPMIVPVKGGFVNWAPTEIYITSNYSPNDWYSEAKAEHVKALLRRLTEVVHYSDPFNLLEN